MKAKSAHKRVEYTIVGLQLGLTCLCIVVTSCISRNFANVMSAAIGAGIVILSTLLYGRIALINNCLAYPAVALKRHQLAMLLRFMLSLILFALVAILYRQCNFVVLFVSYVVCSGSYWLSLLSRA